MRILNHFPITCSEVPDNWSIVISVTGCPHRCRNCHTPQLRDPELGEDISPLRLRAILSPYIGLVDAVCFFGGEQHGKRFRELLTTAKEMGFKTALYTGSRDVEASIKEQLDYLKVGPYIERLGGLDSPTTNQRFYRVEKGQLIDMTDKFRR